MISNTDFDNLDIGQGLCYFEEKIYNNRDVMWQSLFYIHDLTK